MMRYFRFIAAHVPRISNNATGRDMRLRRFISFTTPRYICVTSLITIIRFCVTAADIVDRAHAWATSLYILHMTGWQSRYFFPASDCSLKRYDDSLLFIVLWAYIIFYFSRLAKILIKLKKCHFILIIISMTEHKPRRLRLPHRDLMTGLVFSLFSLAFRFLAIILIH